MPRRYPDAVRRRLEVATARAWEALITAHTRHALRFIAIFSRRMPFDEALVRYLREMDIPPALATGVQTRVLTALEAPEHHTLIEPAPAGDERGSAEAGPGGDGWRRLRPTLVVREVRERQRRHEAGERWIQLAIAQAEEGIIKTHIENAVAFTAVFDSHAPLNRAVEEYITAMDLSGGRAQAVYQRTMARLADVHLPEPLPEPSSRSPDRSL